MAERDSTFSILFRIAIGIAGAAGTAVLWLAYSELTDLKAATTKQAETAWTQIGTLSQSEATLNNAMTGLSATLKDHIQAETQIDADFKAENQDHEQRIRILEHGTPSANH